MKVLFALGSEQLSNRVAEKYLERYGEELDYKNVFYFKALLEEVKRDKTYDRIVVSEELEPFQLKNIEALDKFIFNNIDNITDEIEDSEIIFICSDRRTKDHDKFVERLFNIGVYNALIGDERDISSLCERIKKPMNKKEAKQHLNINPLVSDGSMSTRDDEVEEAQIMNILKYYDSIKGKTDQYVPAFDRIAEQYSRNQLKVILNFLPTDVKNEVLASEKYATFLSDMEMVPNSTKQNPIKTNTVIRAPKKGLFGILKENKNKESAKRTNVIEENLTTNQEELRKKAEQEAFEKEQAEIKAKEEELAREQERLQEQAKKEALAREQEELKYKQEQEALAKEREELKERAEKEAETRRQAEQQAKDLQAAFQKEQEALQKRAEQEQLAREQAEKQVKEQEKQQAKIEKENQTQLNQIEEERKRLEQERIALEEAKRKLKEQSEKLSQSSQIASQVNRVSQAQMSSTPKMDYKKMVVFAGATKSGTTFIANAIAHTIAASNISVGMLDMTKDKSLYFIYNQDDKSLRNIASECMQKLSEGVETYLPGAKNLKIYTSIPGPVSDMGRAYRNKTVIETVKNANSLVVVDADFNSPIEYFEKADEIYVVQDMDIMKMQETTLFLRELKNRGVDIKKVRIVINKFVKCLLTPKKIVEGLSYYNDPQMSFIDELLDNKVQYYIIPLSIENYAKYIDGMYKNSIDFRKFTLDFIQAITQMSNDVYKRANSLVRKKGIFG